MDCRAPAKLSRRRRDRWIRAVLADPELGTAVYAFAMRLALQCEKGSDPSFNDMARAFATDKRTVMHHVRSLKERGWIAVQRYGRGAQNKNHYCFTHPPSVNESSTSTEVMMAV